MSLGHSRTAHKKTRGSKAVDTFLQNLSRKFFSFGQEKSEIHRHLYTPLQDVLGELEKRRLNEGLNAKIDAFFKDFKPPREFGRKPHAVVSRCIISPTIEFEYFVNVKRNLRLDPLMLEFGADKFVARNHEKYGLCRPTFCKKREDGSRYIIKKEHVVDFNTNEGKPLNEVETVWGESLRDFHHSLLHKSGLDKGVEITDFSEWFLKSRTLSDEYYLYYLALFLKHGVLFENFLFNEQEFSFTKTRVLPAFRKLTEMFGVRPLIVPIMPLEEEEQPYWYYYDEKILPFVGHA